MPPDHPARDMQDTLYLREPWIGRAPWALRVSRQTPARVAREVAAAIAPS